MPDAVRQEEAERPDPRSTGARIESLLQASAAAGPASLERSEELVRLLVDLYGAGLERLLEVVDEAGCLGPDLLDRLAGDDLVSSLLLVSGLHPYGIEQRIVRALDEVRPYLGSHGGDIRFVDISPEGVVRLRMLGSCDGCPSSSVTLELAVREALEAAAPEVTGIEVETETTGSTAATSPAASAPAAGVIPVEALRTRLAEEPDAASAGVVHESLEGIDDLADGTLRHLFLDGVPVLVGRWRNGFYAYRDLCPDCASDFTAGTGAGSLQRALGTGDPILTCPGCNRHFDVRRAGAGLEPGTGHLEPFPLLDRGGRLEISLPGRRRTVPA